MLSTTIAKIISINTRDHDILQLECSDSFSEVDRLIRVKWIGTSVAYIAEWTATCALITHDHEGRRTFSKAFSNVRTGGLFADREELVLT